MLLLRESAEKSDACPDDVIFAIASHLQEEFNHDLPLLPSCCKFDAIAEVMSFVIWSRL